MQPLVEPDKFSQMKYCKDFLYQIENIFDTCTSRQWNISQGYIEIQWQASLKLQSLWWKSHYKQEVLSTKWEKEERHVERGRQTRWETSLLNQLPIHH